MLPDDPAGLPRLNRNVRLNPVPEYGYFFLREGERASGEGPSISNFTNVLVLACKKILFLLP